MAKIGWRVWGTPANFIGFRVLALLLLRRRSPEANQTLHDVWPSPGLVHYLYIFGAFAPWRNFARCKLHFASTSCILVSLYWQRYCAALDQWASAKLCSVVQGMELRNWRRLMGGYHVGHRPTFSFVYITLNPSTATCTGGGASRPTPATTPLAIAAVKVVCQGYVLA